MIRKELLIFLLVGGSTVVVDYLTYELLVRTTASSIDVSKAIGFLTGSVYAFFANRYWTFGHEGSRTQSAWKFTLLYLSTMGANVAVNAFLLDPGLLGAPRNIAFLIATGVSAALNFLGMKYFVFRSTHSGHLA